MARKPTPEFDSFAKACSFYNGSASDFERFRALPAAWRGYQREFPYTVHGKNTKRGPEAGSLRKAAFAKEMAKCIGRGRTTIYDWHKKACFLEEHMDPEAGSMILGTTLANNLKVINRIARIPNPEIQRELVRRHDSENSKVKKELEEWEAHFSLSKPLSKKKAAARKPSEPVKSTSDRPTDSKILEALGVSSEAEVLSAIEGLKAQVAELSEKLEAQEKRALPSGEALAQGSDPPTYPNDQERPYRALFKRLVAQTAAEFSGECEIRVFGGREDGNTVSTYLHDGVCKRRLEWHLFSLGKTEFSFQRFPWPQGDVDEWKADGYPETVAEFRSAIREFIRTEVLGRNPSHPSGAAPAQAEAS